MQSSVPAAREAAQVSVGSHLAFILGSALCMLLLFAMARLGLLAYNQALIADTPASTFAESFFNGARFDLRLIVYLCIPLSLSLLSVTAMRARRLHVAWLTFATSLCLFFAVVELNFYREFHQRLNSLVFQYMQEDIGTVASMIWNGFPVLRLLLAWALATLLLAWLFRRIERATRARGHAAAPRWPVRTAVFVLLLLVCVVAARGTLRSGPPLRWGDAYTTDSMFANHLGLNGTLTLIDAADNFFSDHRDNSWKATLPAEEAQQITRDLLLTPRDELIDADVAAVRRVYTPPVEGQLPQVRNVVVILMESMAGRYIGAMGNQDGITPNFDALAKEGLLFQRVFSNGTHTHQGMFATMACFPNLPAFEYLMAAISSPACRNCSAPGAMTTFMSTTAASPGITNPASSLIRACATSSAVTTSSTRYSSTRPGACPTRTCSVAVPTNWPSSAARASRSMHCCRRCPTTRLTRCRKTCRSSASLATVRWTNT